VQVLRWHGFVRVLHTAWSDGMILSANGVDCHFSHVQNTLSMVGSLCQPTVLVHPTKVSVMLSWILPVPTVGWKSTSMSRKSLLYLSPLLNGQRWYDLTLTLRAERQSARMSKITNDGLTQSDTGCFMAVPWASKG